MNKSWLICCVESQQAWLQQVATALDATREMQCFEDPLEARSALYTQGDGSTNVLVGASVVADAINVAAGFAHDGCAQEVVLAQGYCSGSLRKRAGLAGISRVLDTNEMQELVRAASENGAHVVGTTIRPSSQVADRDVEANLSNTLELPDEVREQEVEKESATVRLAGKHFEVQAGFSANPNPCIVLASARGGVGKSACATMMATAASLWGLRVALVDLDLAFGDLFTFFSLDGPADLSQVGTCEDAAAYKKLGRAVSEHLSVFGPCSRPEYAETVAPHVTPFLKTLAQEYDVVIVDSSTNWSDITAQAVQMADRVALVTDERAGAIGSLARAAGLCKRLGVPRTRLLRLMNRADIKRRDEGFMLKAQLGLEAAKVLKVFEGDFDVEEFLDAGHAEDLYALEEPFGKSCAKAIAHILADLGCLPESELAQKALKAEISKKPSIFSFGSKAS